MKLFIAAALVAIASAQIDYPGDYCCELFDDWEYEGTSKLLCIDNDTGPEGKWFNLYHEDFNNITKSFWCGSKVIHEFGINYPNEYHG